MSYVSNKLSRFEVFLTYKNVVKIVLFGEADGR
jgi:hypothetical protein